MRQARLLLACGLLAWGVILAVGALPASAIPPFKKEFDKMYVKENPATPQEKALAEIATTAKCNICHIGGSKKKRNEYGKALDELLDKKADAKDLAKIDSALVTVAAKHSNPQDPKSPTFGDLIKQGKLPGGLDSLKKSGDDEDEDEEEDE